MSAKPERKKFNKKGKPSFSTKKDKNPQKFKKKVKKSRREQNEIDDIQANLEKVFVD